MVQRKDLTGKRFGKLVAIEYLGSQKWLCQCDCGKQTIVRYCNIRDGRTLSCGCLRASIALDLLGQRFGRLEVIGHVRPEGSDRAMWDCLCDCGNRTLAKTTHLTSGYKQSCGCFRSETASTNHTTHGLSTVGQKKRRLYTTWLNMKRRCYNPDATYFEYYGGRGISVCEEWLQDFSCFYDWAMSNGYTDKLTLDRIDSNGNYEPSNCRWVMMREQSNNTRKNRLMTYDGETHTVAEWARIKGIPYNRLYQRIHTYKMPFEKAISMP